MSRSLSRAAQGAAVPHRKHTAAMATVRMPLPSRILLPMAQHIGAPAKPVVKKGDHVDVGSLVGAAAGYVSANIHSGVSGTVEDVTTLMMPGGAEVAAVEIRPDGAQTVDAGVRPPVVEDTASFLAAIAASGLVGLGGAGFPTHVKLSPKDPGSIKYLLINAAECEPYLTADCRALLEDGDEIVDGIRLVRRYIGVKRAIICIERNKPEAIDEMFRLTARDPDIEVRPLLSRYPQGAEKVLIHTVLGREVPAGGLPADAGVIVLNAATVAFIARYIRTGMPLVTKRLTVDGDVVARRQNVEVIVGTPVGEVLDFCGGTTQPAAKVLMGGPMMGTALPSTDYPVLKQNNGLLALGEKAAHMPPESPCIHCGRCVAGCPMGLAPAQIASAHARRDVTTLARLHTMLCVECGTCSYLCPAGRPITQTMRLAKAVLKEAR